MLASLQWLRERAPVETDGARVAEILTARGLTVDSVDPNGPGGDTVIEIDVPANRPDCLGHVGIARELAAATGVGLVLPECPDGLPEVDGYRVTIEAPELCGRFALRRVRGVRVGPSPPEVVERLEACGLRSVNNVVDISNLVMLDVGQPVHFYDAAKLRGGAIGVRAARGGERVTTLDGVEREAPAGAPLIVDAEGVIGLGGIMGGVSTEISEATTEVLVEAAWFRPGPIRRTARRTGLHTDASHRFERGCDPEAPTRAQALAAEWLARWADGTADAAMTDVAVDLPQAASLDVRAARVETLLGYRPDDAEIAGALTALELAPEPAGDGVFRVRIPSWRVDLEREADLVEEVARHLGYDRIPTTFPAASGTPVIGSTHEFEESARSTLATLGFHEAFNYAMIPAGADAPFVDADAVAALPIENPISAELAVLRRSLVPGLLASVDRNLRRGTRDVRLFEVGRVFFARRDELPEERFLAGFAWVGAASEPHWSGETRLVDLYDVAGVVEATLTALRPGVAFAGGDASRVGGLHPAYGMAWTAPDGTPVARAAALHPDVRDRMDLGAEVWLAEIDLDRTRAVPAATPSHRALPKVPGVVRDLSIVLDAGASYADVERALRSVDSPAPVRFVVADRYAGKGLGDGRVGLTIRVILQPLDETLTEDRVEAYRLELVQAVERSGRGRLRS